MKKAKKFIYPFIFSISFFLSYVILSIVLSIVLPSGDYAGLAYALIFLLIWIFIAMPIYSFKYCKLIHKEKHKFLFGFYNPFVIVLCLIGPFIINAGPSSFGVIVSIAVGIFGWVAIWTFMPLILRAIYRTAESSAENETQI